MNNSFIDRDLGENRENRLSGSFGATPNCTQLTILESTSQVISFSALDECHSIRC